MTSDTPRSESLEAAGPTCVLVADDEEPIRNLLRMSLEKLGFEVSLAKDGVEALELWAPNRFSAIILDVRMPGKDGVEVMEAIRQQDQEVPILFITGNPDLDSARRAIIAGASDYLLKPFDIVELRSRVTRAIDGLNLRRENALQQRELEERYAKILALEKKRAQLFQLLVGEMCEPLTDLKFQLEVVASGVLAPVVPEVKELIEGASQDVQRLWKITRDLFDMHMLENGNLYQSAEIFQMRPALEEAGRTGRWLSRRKDAGEVVVEVEPDFELESNRDLLVRAVASLVCSLIELSPPGVVTAVNGCETLDGFEISVSSDSVPVSREVWEEGFSGFSEQLAQAGLSGPACLGLPLARQITEVMGGTFQVESRAGSESSAAHEVRFMLVLPRVSA